MNRPADRSSTHLQVTEDIIPVGQLKAHLSERLRELRTRGRPFVVTQNGKAAAVLLSPEQFDRLNSHARFMAAVSEGLADADAGRVMDDDELARRLHARFAEDGQSK